MQVLTYRENVFLICISKDDFLEFLKNRGSFANVQEITRDEVGNERNGRDDAEFREGREEGVVCRHKREELGH